MASMSRFSGDEARAHCPRKPISEAGRFFASSRLRVANSWWVCSKLGAEGGSLKMACPFESLGKLSSTCSRGYMEEQCRQGIEAAHEVAQAMDTKVKSWSNVIVG
ncbi:hypothetical protein CCM_06102 [Cordyceps militaris CM01]|uniref:Uncharacterized protein n=1 Tax=Cordyceps militaris (strain CM01) TaxID=983644 RepID=G3JIU8_CORMM|nr:uncharacterized protein CCM_06102 [Cordyceps militaris CM01]EGX91942.1 hypothetical protein CCM_06102 [Cordyceps militaris CM01]